MASLLKQSVKQPIKQLWWLHVIVSLAAIIFGIATLFMPGLTLATMVALFAAFIVIVGLIELVGGFSQINTSARWWLSVLVGIVLLGAGIYLVNHPDISLAAFVVTIGWVLIARGLSELAIGAFFARDENRVLWVIGGLASIVAGIVIWVYPADGLLAFTWVLGLYALVSGAVSLAVAFDNRDRFEATTR